MRSQSGRSVEMIRLLELRDRFRMIGVTNAPDSLLAQRADATVLTQAGEEYTVSCKTYVAGLAALAGLSDVLCGCNVRRISAELTDAAAAAEAYLASWRERVCSLNQEMCSVRYLFLVGREESLATAGTGGLFGLVFLIFFVVSLLTNILAPIIPGILQSFRLSLTAAAFLLFSFFVAYG